MCSKRNEAGPGQLPVASLAPEGHYGADNKAGDQSDRAGDEDAEQRPLIGAGRREGARRPHVPQDFFT